jgi:hypothetical protein
MLPGGTGDMPMPLALRFHPNGGHIRQHRVFFVVQCPHLIHRKVVGPESGVRRSSGAAKVATLSHLPWLGSGRWWLEYQREEDDCRNVGEEARHGLFNARVGDTYGMFKIFLIF